jgi:hypothetical protein
LTNFGGTLLILNKATSLPITIGGGGAGGVLSKGTIGENTTAFSLTANGGGFGGGDADFNGGSGGSGGGAARTGNKGLGDSPQGKDGGLGTGPIYYLSGGGGGAGTIGTNASGSTSGNGGSGVISLITGISVTYAMGAAGSGSGFRGGSNGINPVGAGLPSSNGIGGNATVNLGGGGGAGFVNGGSGGRGVVIVRWLTLSGTITVGAGLEADPTGTDGAYSYKVITNGTGNISFN